jgi:hypothetical protein
VLRTRTGAKAAAPQQLPQASACKENKAMLGVCHRFDSPLPAFQIFLTGARRFGRTVASASRSGETGQRAFQRQHGKRRSGKKRQGKAMQEKGKPATPALTHMVERAETELTQEVVEHATPGLTRASRRSQIDR